MSVRTSDAELRATLDALEHAATHDGLTGLANRVHVLTQLHEALTLDPHRTSARRSGLAVLFLDLDHFKLVNDTMGHHAGDQLLAEFARRLRTSVRDDDLIGRFGGDEFVVGIRHEGIDDARAAGDRILAALAEPFTLMGRTLTVSASIGMSIAVPGEHTHEQMLQEADTALFEAKRLGRGRLEMFTTELRRRVVDRVELETDLRVALDEQRLRLHYQPQIDLRTGRIVGVEALARWRHPTRGLVPPKEFIAVAEESGLIRPLGRWAINEACRQMASWRRTNGWAPPVVTVNVSPLQLDSNDIVEQVERSLAVWKLSPSMLTLELTESALMGGDHRLDVLNDLRALGCFIGLDDFGTGYSSLSRLRDLPVEILKIDRSFVDGLGVGSDDEAIVASIMSMALALGLHVIAEGVEEERQVRVLRRLGCEVAQGYFFAPPLTGATIAERGHRRLWRPPSVSAVDGAAPNRGHRRFVHEFLHHLGVPMTGPADRGLEATS